MTTIWGNSRRAISAKVLLKKLREFQRRIILAFEEIEEGTCASAAALRQGAEHPLAFGCGGTCWRPRSCARRRRVCRRPACVPACVTESAPVFPVLVGKERDKDRHASARRPAGAAARGRRSRREGEVPRTPTTARPVTTRSVTWPDRARDELSPAHAEAAGVPHLSSRPGDCFAIVVVIYLVQSHAS